MNGKEKGIKHKKIQTKFKIIVKFIHKNMKR